MSTYGTRLERGSWALYDFANTIFPMNVATLYFAVWFVEDLHQSNTWIVLLLAMVAVPTQNAFWAVGLAIGLIFGWVPTAERPLLLSLVPEEEAGRFFSSMLLSSRAAAVAGPLIWGVTVDSLEPGYGSGLAYRVAVLTVAAMFAAAFNG